MRRENLLNIFFGLIVSVSTLPLAAFAQSSPSTVPAQENRSSTQAKTVVARIWHGKTLTSKAAEYYDYLKEAGIKKIESIPGNLGAQVLRLTDGKITEFTVISYWESRDAIRAFAGNDIEKVRSLPKDNEYLIEPETKVKHFDVLLDDRK
ncbi:antibiotic biosynthesis monooxygenase family protein [Dendronalium sp. ChiSLP03b]|uniref:antibiotic biosynthesis monooxygenase family protein n=1 Tax=Dendronalium sp. ChiSLP03b TaxID=3075381 RepID=UPI002AD57F82|nr:antibiotic biosynthesis monooxygenase family protein [Dendronalium sp. ChiSLP03b]MDZ8206504.1 antibiotic biosynthesis monooxygenase family protein [Dendronalium sp. ChiSLP03b]